MAAALVLALGGCSGDAGTPRPSPPVSFPYDCAGEPVPSPCVARPNPDDARVLTVYDAAGSPLGGLPEPFPVTCPERVQGPCTASYDHTGPRLVIYDRNGVAVGALRP